MYIQVSLCGLDVSHLCIILYKIYFCIVLYKMFTLLQIQCTYIHNVICLLEQREWDSWAHEPGLTHLSLVHSPGTSVVLCALSIAIVLY